MPTAMLPDGLRIGPREYNISQTQCLSAWLISMSRSNPAGQVQKVEFSTLVEFTKLVSDSESSEGVFALLAQTVVEKCGAIHALVFGTSGTGDFALLSSYGACEDKEVGS